ncbi:hypothetical protein GYMLUDRAFT_245735 [Collybiopsis luxurians FD-317 M1]|uniref:Uncharacterized protein n=1 Tax=Collybiopsis luxurians FD-317 M1 TaxID=944289 RepID=A0A0D0B6D4_9AGAR|nr:hypothetical protein GYMLUDRAFT_245735 [Collybiopsis luxurians FD-317 M1]
MNTNSHTSPPPEEDSSSVVLVDNLWWMLRTIQGLPVFQTPGPHMEKLKEIKSTCEGMLFCPALSDFTLKNPLSPNSSGYGCSAGAPRSFDVNESGKEPNAQTQSACPYRGREFAQYFTDGGTMRGLA